MVPNKSERSAVQQKRLNEAVRFVQSKIADAPKIALVLGSGLGDFADAVEIASTVSSDQIPFYPQSSVQGHAGKLNFGLIRGKSTTSKPLLVFKGRVHFYESGSLDSVVFPVLLAHKLGARTLIVTNAAGGINRNFRPGQLMLIRDFINLTFLIPARTEGLPQPRENRLDANMHIRNQNRMKGYFDDDLQNSIRSAARDLHIDLQEGTYCWLKGPTYETAAEVLMLEKIGADAVGMSTVPEIVTAKKLAMRVAGISLISNLATGISQQKLSHQEVTETANSVKESFTNFMRDVILRI